MSEAPLRVGARLGRGRGAALDLRATRLAAVVVSALARVLAWWPPRPAVLHVSYAVHVPWQATRVLRRHGVQADFLSVGRSWHWDRYDYLYEPGRWPGQRAVKEAWWVLRVVLRYQAVHLHFGMTLTRDGWELPILRRLGRRIVVHFRGCEVRDRDRNMARHPDNNICQHCDHRPYICHVPAIVERTRRALANADHVLVTTPDMLDFLPEAEHLPFFAPELSPCKQHSAGSRRRPLRIVHATNQPGIEGTTEIVRVVEKLKALGRPIELEVVSGVTHEKVLDAFRGADLTIGKMKMGYYANTQIESMMLGVPAITWVRPDLLTPELHDSGFILCKLTDLEGTIERLLDEPELLQSYRKRACKSVLALHDNGRICARLAQLYDLVPSLSGGVRAA